MTHPATCFRVLVFLLLLLPRTPNTASAQQLLSNGEFGSGTDGWTLGFPDPSTGALMSWDANLGDPELGSLELEGGPALGAQTSVEAWSPCFELDPAHLPRLQARMRRASSEGIGRCRATFIRYDGPGCTGDRTFSGSGGDPLPPIDAWLSSTEEWGSPIGDDASYRVSLALAYLIGTAVCNFDSVSLTLDGIAAPTLGGFGILALIVGVAGAALFVIPRLTR